MINLHIEPSGWGEAATEDIHRLLCDVCEQLLIHTQSIPDGLIIVKPGDTDYPEVKYRQSASNPYVIHLSARGRSWCQYSYQFAHELCHVISGYERLRLPENMWFHESLCELASIFVLRQMARTWRSAAPYPSWASYSEALSSYATDIIEQPGNVLAPGSTFSDWLSFHEPGLRVDQYQRQLNRLVAVRLLPHFERSPRMWRAIPHLPNSTAHFHLYLKEWAASYNTATNASIHEIEEVLNLANDLD